MSIFGKILSAIFGTDAKASSTSVPLTETTTPSAAAAAPQGSTAAPIRESAACASSVSSAAASVDVASVLDKAVAAKGEKLEWKTSIVDLMKALDIDSSLTARKELAKELDYSGDMNNSSEMNVWLHKQVMAKLAANGGKLPADIEH